MKAMIVCVSVSHGNTRKVADAIGAVLNAPVVEPEDVDVAALDACDLVGFGSGIMYQALHPRLRSFVRSLPATERSKAFVVTTSGFRPFTRPFNRLLRRKHFDVLDTFWCRAYDTSFPFGIRGGINKGRPDDADLDAARVFADRLRRRIDSA